MKKLLTVIIITVFCGIAFSAKPTKPAAKETEKPKWDVNQPPGPMKEISIDTDEGTWMSVDVSPDGKEIVFDLLGDIYVMPITGGEAKALTSGISWDMQPRFSPDGKWIAYVSDRAGGNNIWTMKRDGSQQTQVTKEDFRLVNSPNWTPDSEYIVVRKHFTSTRSAGAGEMWLYHRSGGSGLQLTKRPNEQKDAGEPAFSPDGRYLYYSQDTTPGLFFEYDKNSNGQIYVIQRLDRQTGKTVPLITGAGGAIRPTPSHNGKDLAFVRRVRFKSVLYVDHIESGEEESLFDGLDRDMQEAWAINGVYPAFAWTPDDSAIVFWAGGKIQRLDVASKSVTQIPFHVKDTRKIQDALRFPVSVAPTNFDVKLLRWVQVSPSGDEVVYQALGHLYTRKLPDGVPHRLTTQNDHFEFYPSYSRDGKWIVYATWNDQNLGSIRVVSSQGGEGRVITPNPGHYLEPVFSPDGKKVVYRASAGTFLTSPRWSREPGIYWIPVEGGKPTFITTKGSAPQFGASSDRVFLSNSEPNDNPSLSGKNTFFSINLNGSEERIHVRTDHAVEFKISPDEKWLASVELWEAYIFPFVLTGSTIELGPEEKSIPMARVSKDAGEYVHWSGDSKRLHWSMGPQLFTRDLKDAFSYLEGAPAKLPEPPATGTMIGFQQPTDVPSGKIALSGARVISMKGDEVVEDAVILIEGNRIRAIGNKSQVQIPSDALVVDVTGKTIIPGLVDVHWHGAMGEEQITPQQSWVNYATLAFGVTTLHDPSNDTHEIFSMSELQRAGMVTGPRIFSTGSVLYGADWDYKVVINSLEDALANLKRLKAVGAFSVKSYNQPRREQRQQIIEAARELKMMVVPEGGSNFENNMTMVVDGHTGVEHTIPVAKLYKDGIQLWSQSKTEYTPTLVVAYGGIEGERYWYAKTNVWENERLMKYVPREIIDARSRRREIAPDDEWNHFNEARIAAALSKAGVGVHIGAHGQREGLAAHWEIAMLTQGGMTPMEALHAATISGAHYLGMDADIGSLEAGKLADLVVLDKNPLDDIANTLTIHAVMQNGRLYDGETMDEIGNHPRKHQPFFWQDGKTPLVPAITKTQD